MTAEKRQKTKRWDGALAQNKSCQELELQGSCLQMGKNRNQTQYRGNYLKDNTDGDGEKRKLRGRERGTGQQGRGKEVK